jgi:DNA-binding CsgD family transcriptional regulator
MTPSDAITRLATLSERERQVLELKCDGLDYKAIGKELSIAVPTVKYDMGRVYIKLGLDQLSKTERLKTLLNVYCPALAQAALPPGPQEAEEPQPMPRPLVAMIEQDERALMTHNPTDVIIIPPQPTPVKPGPTGPFQLVGCGALLGGLGCVLLIAIGLVAFWWFGGVDELTRVAQVTVVVPASAAPPLPTTPPIIQTVVVATGQVIVVTATPPRDAPTRVPTRAPAQPPTPTPPLDTPPSTHLQVGDTWKQDGVGLTLTEGSLENFQGKGQVYLSFTFANTTGSDLSVAFDIQDMVVEANNGTRFRPFYTDPSGAIWKETIANGNRREVWFYGSTEYSWLGDYFSPDVSFILITVRNWSRIAEANWQIDIQH